MNDLIKQLAEKARIQMCSDARLQEFAELIVDECCNKLLDMDSWVNGNHNYYKHAALEVKKHFRGE